MPSSRFQRWSPIDEAPEYEVSSDGFVRVIATGRYIPLQRRRTGEKYVVLKQGNMTVEHYVDDLVNAHF